MGKVDLETSVGRFSDRQKKEMLKRAKAKIALIGGGDIGQEIASAEESLRLAREGVQRVDGGARKVVEGGSEMFDGFREMGVPEKRVAGLFGHLLSWMASVISGEEDQAELMQQRVLPGIDMNLSELSKNLSIPRSKLEGIYRILQKGGVVGKPCKRGKNLVIGEYDCQVLRVAAGKFGDVRRLNSEAVVSYVRGELIKSHPDGISYKPSQVRGKRWDPDTGTLEK